MPTSHVLKKWYQIFKKVPPSLKSLINEKAQFKAALKVYLNIPVHALCSVDEFLLSENDPLSS
jgi:hypothetical protein